MIPILYGSIEVLFANANDDIFQQTSGELFSTQEQVMDFSTLGIGFLTDCVTCTVKEVRNGEYELEMTYPATGKRFNDIKVGGVIAAVPSKGRQPDYFSIYKVTKPLSGIISVYAEHISYQLSRIPVLPFTAANVQSALQGLKTNSAEDNPFTFWTDKATVANYKQTIPASVRARLGGVQGSILDVYGGEFEFDRYDVKLWANRGADNGVQIRYGKNLTDLNQETNIANTITGVCPYWADNEGNNVVTLPEKVVRSANAGFFPYNRTIVRDFSSDFEEKPTQEQLRAAAVKYVNQSGIGVPDVSTKVSFVDLSTADDYEDLALLETVKLCDIVTVIFEPYDVKVRAKVTETIWNVLKDRYDSVTLGNATTKLTSVVASSDKAVTEEIQAAKSSLAHAIDTATEQITGVNGGYVRFNYDANDNPYEFLIMNTPDIETATRVWRWNQNGLGVSNNGYEGPFELAMTSDGHFVADFITAGTLNANDVTISNLTVGMISGSISGSGGWGINFTDGTMSIGTLAVDSITGSITNGGWGINFTNGTMSIGTLAVGSITGSLTTTSTSGSAWGIDFTNGTMNIGTLAVSKITGTQSLGNNWAIDFDDGTMTIGNLSANNITAGTITAAVTATNLTMSGGSIDIVTDSSTTDRIVLRYNDYSTKLSSSRLVIGDSSWSAHYTANSVYSVSNGSAMTAYALGIGTYGGQLEFRSYPVGNSTRAVVIGARSGGGGVEIYDTNGVKRYSALSSGHTFYDSSGGEICTISPVLVASW